eukprot:6370493-Amphidinium_carterae.1
MEGNLRTCGTKLGREARPTLCGEIEGIAFACVRGCAIRSNLRFLTWIAGDFAKLARISPVGAGHHAAG